MLEKKVTAKRKNTRFVPQMLSILVQEAVQAALKEDLGLAGDITTNSTIPVSAKAVAVLASRENGIISGMDAVTVAFNTLDPSLNISAHVRDGSTVKKGSKIATIKGSARSILSAERVALNFLMRMSGIATYTAQFVKQVEGTGAQVCCTRKTIPNLRAFDKYAVNCGGGSNHRFRLDDAVLIKDNHIAVAGSIAKAINAAKAAVGHLVKVEVEVDTLAQFAQALKAKPDVILLDNMTNTQLAKAVEKNQLDNGGQIKLEASGNVNIDTIGEIAKTGVDYISTSKITMAAPTLDVGLDIAVK